MRIAILDDYQDVALSGTPTGRACRDRPRSRCSTSTSARHELLAATLRPFDVIVAMRERTAFPASLLALLPDLGLLVTTGMGNAAIDLAAARERGVTVCGTGGHPAATGELTWGLILALTRHIPEEDWRMRAATRAGGAALSSRGGWQRTDRDGPARQAARRGRAGPDRPGGVRGRAGVRHAGRGLEPEPGSRDQAREIDVEPVSKEQLFARSDVVTIHYKLSPRSTGLVGAAELGLMKPTAYLVNTSRGPIVDGSALVTALRDGQIAGAALDVYDTEPLPLGDALRSLPNTVLTPHLGYVTDETYQVFYREAVEDIAAFVDGSPVRVLND